MTQRKKHRALNCPRLPRPASRRRAVAALTPAEVQRADAAWLQLQRRRSDGMRLCHYLTRMRRLLQTRRLTPAMHQYLCELYDNHDVALHRDADLQRRVVIPALVRYAQDEGFSRKRCARCVLTCLSGVRRQDIRAAWAPRRAAVRSRKPERPRGKRARCLARTRTKDLRRTRALHMAATVARVEALAVASTEAVATRVAIRRIWPHALTPAMRRACARYL
jgi:hypothetical protein